MKDNTKIFTIITYVILVSSASILLNDIREFDFNQFKAFQNWPNTANKNESWFRSENAIKWSSYVISVGLFFLRGYLIYGFAHFLTILKEVELGYYFSDKNIKNFKKVGNVFVTYTINVLVLRFFLSAINGSSFHFINELTI